MQRKELYSDDEKLLRRLSFPFCSNKIQYVLKKHAESVRRQMERISNTSFDKYKCKYCRFWHIGHTNASRLDLSAVGVIINEQKKCWTCKKTKDKSEFRVRSNGKWLRIVCKACELTNPPIADQQPEIHGVPMDVYNALLKAQNFQCALCSCNASSLRSGYFLVDKDPATDYIRGLICTACNTLLESLKFDVIFVAKIFEYLLCEAKETNESK